MAFKRKFSDEFDDVAPINGKQQKLIPFPNSSELDSDVAMSDASISDLEPLTIPAHHFHTRLPSDASYASSSTSDSPRNSPFYPVFDLYPSDSDSYMGISAHGLPDPTFYAPQKFPNFVWPVPLAPMGEGQCGPIVKNAARSRSLTETKPTSTRQHLDRFRHPTIPLHRFANDHDALDILNHLEHL